jgi:AcrR family transcriptional regulator
MQDKKTRIPNKTRTETTKAALMSAARRLFVAKGYAETGTPEIVSAAKVTRGALYHHFDDKLALFRAVIMHEASEVETAIRINSSDQVIGVDALMTGADAYFDAMAETGRAKLLLIEGPAVLGRAVMSEIDQATGGEELRQGLLLAMPSQSVDDAVLGALAETLSAAFDCAALAIAEGENSINYRAALKKILEGLL